MSDAYRLASALAALVVLALVFADRIATAREYVRYSHAFDHSTNDELLTAMNRRAFIDVPYAGEVTSIRKTPQGLEITLNAAGELAGRSIMVRSGAVHQRICERDKINGMGRLVAIDLNAPNDATIDGHWLIDSPYVPFRRSGASSLLRLFGWCP